MANLTESSVWEDGVYRLETTDPTLGGPPIFQDGVPITGWDNAQAQQLANRTKYLKTEHETLVTEVAGKVSATDLANSTDPVKGAGLVGWERSALSVAVGSVGQVLSTRTINAWEFSYLITDKPNPSDPSTWDWSPAIQAAADAFGTDSQDADKEGVLELGPGIHIIKSTIELPYNVGLRGAGANATTLQASTTLTGPVVKFRKGKTHGGEYRKFNIFEGFRVRGSYPTTNHIGQHGIDLSPDYGWSNLSMRDVWISDCGGDGLYMNQPDKSYQNGFLSVFTNVYIRNCRRGLMNDGGFFGDSTFVNCNFSRCREEQIRLEPSSGTPSIPGQSLDGNQNLNFVGCIIEFASKGFYLAEGAGRLQMNFYGGHFEALDEYGVKLSDGSNQTITNFYGTLFATNKLPIWMEKTGRVNCSGCFFEGVVDGARNDYTQSNAIRMDLYQHHLHIGDGCTVAQEYTTAILNSTAAPTFYRTGFDLHTKTYTTAKEFRLQTLYVEPLHVKSLQSYNQSVRGGNNALIKKSVSNSAAFTTVPLNTEPDASYSVLVTTTWDSGAYVIEDANKTTTAFRVTYANPAPATGTHYVHCLVFRGDVR